MKKIMSLVASAMLAASMLVIPASAAALDDIGGGQTTVEEQVPANNGAALSSDDATIEQSPSGGGTIGNVYSDVGIDQETMEQAKKAVSPIVKGVNIAIGVIVALLGTVLLAITALDLLYIVSPSFIRNIGATAAAPQAQGMMGGQAQAQPAASGFASLISDDCRNAIAECGEIAAPGMAAPGMGAPGMGGGFGGGYGGMGGFGGGFGGGMGAPGMGAQTQAKPKAKKVVLCYLKKRVFTFVLIGVCAVVLTCTCFLDLGTNFGQWIVDKVSGIA